MLEGRYTILLLIVAFLISGTAAAGLAYWVANAIIAHGHSGDPLQAQGGLKPSQDVGGRK